MGSSFLGLPHSYFKSPKKSFFVIQFKDTRMKVCTKCQIPQPLENFSNSTNTKDKKNHKCKLCCKQYREENKEKVSEIKKQWYENNKEHTLNRIKQYREDNKEIIALKSKKFREENKEKLSLDKKRYREGVHRQKLLLKKKQYREENKEKIHESLKQWYDNNKEKCYLKGKKYREENKDEIAVKMKQYGKDNREHLNRTRNIYMKTPIGKLIQHNRNSRRRTITKQGDVTTAQLKELLDNSTHCFYCNNPLVLNEIHIDHYIPLAKKGLHTITNLRIACKKCNLEKSDQMPEEFMMLKK